MRLPPYWRAYWAHAAFWILTIGILLVLLLWAYSLHQSCFGFIENLVHMAEPISAFLGALVSLLLIARVSSRLRELRSWAPGSELEELEDHSCSPWRAINHSYHRIEWTPDVPQRLRSHLIEFFTIQAARCCLTRLQFLMGTCVLEQLREETGTMNFRVLRMLAPTKFVRVYKSIDEKELECRQEVARHILKSGVFDSAAAKCLIPDLIRNGPRGASFLPVWPTLSRFVAGTIADEAWEVQMFPYADVDDHFSGGSLEEIESFAALFGRVQTAMASAPEDLEKKVHEAQQFRREHKRTGAPELSAENLQARFDDMEPEIKRGLRRGLVPGLTEKALPEIRYIVQRCVEMRKRYAAEGTSLLLHDVHPQNVFFRAPSGGKDRECELIYDYHWAGHWNHAVVLAFAMHRFVREFVRRQVELNVGAHIRKGASKFLESYSRHCRLPLPSSFKADIDGYILCANVEKLLNSLERSLKRAPDDLKRTDARLMGEVRKFLRFKEEAAAFAEALNG